jgi:hypothetical protein
MKAKMWSRKSESREEIAAFEQLAYQNTEPNFHLIHPGSVLRRIVKHYLVGGVVQKGRAAFHRPENPTFALDAQRLRCKPVLLGHPTHQRFGLMDVQVVQHEMPLRRFGIASNQTSEMGQCILLGPCWSPGRFDDVPGDDIKIDEPGQRAVPNVLKFTSQHIAGQHGQVGMLAL